MKKEKHWNRRERNNREDFFSMGYARTMFWLLGIAVLVFIVYRSVMNFDLVNWDDRRYLKETAVVQGLTWEHVKEMFQVKVLRSYNPVVLLSFALDYRIAKLDPGWCHSVNLFLHIINAMMVFILFKKMRFRREVAGLIAILFAVHPLVVEAVAWIAGRKDVLYGFFFLLACNCYVNYYHSRKKIYYVLSLFFFILSLFSKVQAVTLPLILFLIDYMLSKEWKWKNLLNKIPFFVLSFVFGIVAVWGGNMVADKYAVPPDFSDKLSYSFMAFGLYLQKIILPFYQCSIYSFPDDGSAEYLRLFIKGIISVAIFILLIAYSIKRAPSIAGGLLFYCILIAVVMHIVAFNSALIYERFIYLGCIGLFTAFMSLDQVFPAWAKYRSRVSAVVILGFCFLTYNRVFIWSNSETMWSDVIRKNPESFTPFVNRGMVYMEKGDTARALLDFNEAIRLAPSRPDGYNNRSVIFYNRKEFRSALADNDKVLEIDSAFNQALINRACIYFGMEMFDSSAYYYTRSLDLAPRNISSNYFCALAFQKAGRYNEAIAKFKRAIDLQPDHADALAFLAITYADIDRFDSAMYYIKKAESVNPGSAARQLASNEYVRKGTAQLDVGKRETALDYYKKATEMMPSNAEAFYNMGGVYLLNNDFEKSRACWKKTLTLNPKHKEANLWLARISN